MQNIVLTQTGTGSSRVAIPDFFKDTFNIGLQAIVTGTVTYTVWYTLDDTQADGYVPSTGNWFPVASQMLAATATNAAQLVTPCKGIYLQVTAGTGTVALTIQQAGTR